MVQLNRNRFLSICWRRNNLLTLKTPSKDLRTGTKKNESCHSSARREPIVSHLPFDQRQKNGRQIPGRIESGSYCSGQPPSSTGSETRGEEKHRNNNNKKKGIDRCRWRWTYGRTGGHTDAERGRPNRHCRRRIFSRPHWLRGKPRVEGGSCRYNTHRALRADGMVEEEGLEIAWNNRPWWLELMGDASVGVCARCGFRLPLRHVYSAPPYPPPTPPRRDVVFAGQKLVSAFLPIGLNISGARARPMKNGRPRMTRRFQSRGAFFHVIFFCIAKRWDSGRCVSSYWNLFL